MTRIYLLIACLVLAITVANVTAEDKVAAKAIEGEVVKNALKKGMDEKKPEKGIEGEMVKSALKKGLDEKEKNPEKALEGAMAGAALKKELGGGEKKPANPLLALLQGTTGGNKPHPLKGLLGAGGEAVKAIKK